MGPVEESDVIERREKKHKKKEKGLLKLEDEGIGEDGGGKSNEGDKIMKKKEKRKKKDGDGDASGEELFGEKDQMVNEHEERVKEKKRKKERKNTVMEEGEHYDRGEDTTTGKNHVERQVSHENLDLSKAEKKKEKKNGVSYLQDGDASGEELFGKKDRMTNGQEKEHVREKKRKKEKKNKVMEEGGSYDRGEETPTEKNHVERQVNSESLHLSKVEKKLDHEIEQDDTKRKKEEKKWKHMEGVTDSLSETQNYKKAGKNIIMEPESEEQDISVDTEAGEGYTTNREEKKSKKKKHNINGNVDSLLPSNSGENSTKDKKRKKSIGDEEERSTIVHVEEGHNIDKGSSKKRKKENKSKSVTEDHSREILEATVDREKKKSKKNKDNIDKNVGFICENNTKDKKRKNITGDEEKRNTLTHVEGNNNIDTWSSKKGKKKNNGKNDTKDNSREILEIPVDIGNTAVSDVGDGLSGDRHNLVGKKKNKGRDNETVHVEKENVDKNTREKGKSIKSVNITSSKEDNAGSENTETKKPSKRVKFSGKVEVFPLSSAGDAPKENREGGLVRGKRFSKEEDEMIKNAVFNYIKVHNLGDDGLQKVLRCGSHPEIKNCWKEISAAIPWRPTLGVYSRAHVLFERAESREWTDEDLEFIKKFHEKHGSDWRALGDEMKRSRIHVKDTWRRRVSLPNKKHGPWSQEEYQKLFDLVNMDLRMKVFEEKKSQHGMLRDNIAWDAISKNLSTRSNDVCCRKWYGQLESPLVRDGKWASSDDFRLLRELVDKDYSSVEEVDWDNLLDHRPGDICRKRWYQMVNHLGEHGCKEFADQLEVLMKRYCPDVLETREALESKVPID